MQEELIYDIALSRIDGIGSVMFRQLINTFGSAEEVFKASSPKLMKIPNLGKVTISNLKINLDAFAEAKEKITVQAKGMVCGFCAQGIEKKFKALPEVADIKVSLETKKVDIAMKEGSTVSDETIKKILTESGYELVKIERTK